MTREEALYNIFDTISTENIDDKIVIEEKYLKNIINEIFDDFENIKCINIKKCCDYGKCKKYIGNIKTREVNSDFGCNKFEPN